MGILRKSVQLLDDLALLVFPLVAGRGFGLREASLEGLPACVDLLHFPLRMVLDGVSGLSGAAFQSVGSGIDIAQPVPSVATKLGYFVGERVVCPLGVGPKRLSRFLLVFRHALCGLAASARAHK